MIFGVGSDIVAIERMREMWRRHGERAPGKLLAFAERQPCCDHADPGRFLAKRFAAKEALGKALGLGMRAPVLFTAISVSHDDLGKPIFAFDSRLAGWMQARRLLAHLSISDEAQYAVAFVVVERQQELS